MKFFIVLSCLMAVAIARPNLTQLLPHSVQSSSAASASASLSPQRLLLLHTLPGLDPRFVNTLEAPATAREDQVVDTSEVSLAKAEHSAAHKNERIRLANQDAQVAAAQAQAQQQLLLGPNSLLSSTRQAHSTASVNPTGASSFSSAQVIESPQLNAVRLAQHQALAAAATRQALRFSSAQPLLVGLDGQLLSTPPFS